jgi:hypothetical protein
MLPHRPPRPATCTVPECDRPNNHYRDYCSAHYQRLRVGLPLDTPIRVLAENPVCSIEGCNRPHEGRGYCKTHNARRRNGHPAFDTPIRTPKLDCSVPGCTRLCKRKGYCDAHYSRYKNGRPLDVPIGSLSPLRQSRPVKLCSVEGCGNRSRAKGMCNLHYDRTYRAPRKRARKPNPNGSARAGVTRTGRDAKRLDRTQ